MSAATPEPGATGRAMADRGRLREMSERLNNEGWLALTGSLAGDVGFAWGLINDNMVTCAVGSLVTGGLSLYSMHCFRTRALLGKILRGELL